MMSSACFLQCKASAQATAGLIFPAGSTGAWDEGGVGHPVVGALTHENDPGISA